MLYVFVCLSVYFFLCPWCMCVPVVYQFRKNMCTGFMYGCVCICVCVCACVCVCVLCVCVGGGGGG